MRVKNVCFLMRVILWQKENSKDEPTRNICTKHHENQDSQTLSENVGFAVFQHHWFEITSEADVEWH